MRSRRSRSGLLAAVSLLAACEVAVDTVAPDEGPPDPIGYVAAGLAWTSSTLSVCWENGFDAWPAERELVRTAVASTWEAASSVRFVGWRPCAEGPANIRIGVEDVGPHTKGLGDSIDGYAHGMVLNFTFDAWGQPCKSMRDHCIRAIAVHEFGHALSFSHEQNRADTPDWCTEEPDVPGDVTVGAWDVDSVMNYCNPTWNGDGQLSAGDVATVQRFYGTVPFAAVDPGLDPTHARSFANGALGAARSLDTYGDGAHAAFMAPRGWFSGQRWYVVPDPFGHGRYRLTNEFLGDGWALTGDLDGGPLTMQPVVHTGATSAAQRWMFTAVDGGYRLSNAALGAGSSIDTYPDGPDGNSPFMAPSSASSAGQIWSAHEPAGP